MKNTQREKTAFSFIELSIVILIISVIVSMFFGGTILIKTANLTSLRAASQKSPVYHIKDNSVWLDLSGENSFSGNYPDDGDSISSWLDVSPYLETNINFTQGTGSVQPTFVYDPVDDMPAISFDGGDLLSSSTTIRGFDLAQSQQITIFMVQKYNSPNNASNTVFWQPTGANEINVSALNASGNLTWDYGADQITATTPSNFNDVWNIVTLVRQSANNGLIRVNGAQLQSASMPDADGLDVTAADNLDIGVGYDGLIREIIIYKRELSAREIEDIEKYLSTKWEIDLD